MNISQLLLLLLLSFESASARLVERQELWPAVGVVGDLVWGSIKLLQGTVDTFQGSDSGSESGSSEKDPPYDNSPVLAPPLDSPAIAPISPSPSDPPYKLEINNLNSPSQLPGFVPNLPALAAPVKVCDSTNASPQISDFFTIRFQRLAFA